MFKTILAFFTKAEKTATEIAADARVLLVSASEQIAIVLEDADSNGLPDVAERVARHAARVVSALELIHGHASGKGAEKLNATMYEVLAAARRGQKTWELAKPFVEAAVALLPRKRYV